MPFRPSEVWTVLAIVLIMLGAKHVPMFSFLPMTQAIGIVCFAFAIRLCWGIRNELMAEAAGR